MVEWFLLRHDLGDEDRVRVARLAPRKISTVLAEPGQEQLLHMVEPKRRRGLDGGSLSDARLGRS
jgi:hypothetical protein